MNILEYLMVFFAAPCYGAVLLWWLESEPSGWRERAWGLATLTLAPIAVVVVVLTAVVTAADDDSAKWRDGEIHTRGE